MADRRRLRRLAQPARARGGGARRRGATRGIGRRSSGPDRGAWRTRSPRSSSRELRPACANPRPDARREDAGPAARAPRRSCSRDGRPARTRSHLASDRLARARSAPSPADGGLRILARRPRRALGDPGAWPSRTAASAARQRARGGLAGAAPSPGAAGARGPPRRRRRRRGGRGRPAADPARPPRDAAADRRGACRRRRRRRASRSRRCWRTRRRVGRPGHRRRPHDRRRRRIPAQAARILLDGVAPARRDPAGGRRGRACSARSARSPDDEMREGLRAPRATTCSSRSAPRS